MKIWPFFILAVHTHYVLSVSWGHRKYPKKVISSVRDPKIVLSRKILDGKTLRTAPLKQSTRDKGYTVFPPIGSVDTKFHLGPESPYFAVELIGDQATRVKKVLPEYSTSHVIHKRSASSDNLLKVKKNNTRRLSKKDRKKKAKRSHGDTTHHPGNKKSKRLHKPKVVRTIKKQKNANKGSKKNKSNSTKVSAKKVVGKIADDARRLIGARDAAIEDYPYVVSIQKDGDHWCAGALLNPRLVITTANCIWKSKRASRMHVRAGSRRLDEGGQLVGIQEVMKHPSWSIRGTPDNDIALLLLDEKIKFSDKVHGVDLPNRLMSPVFQDAWVTGWGAERRDGVFDKQAMTLQVYHALVVDRNKCNQITKRYGIKVADNFICLSQTGKRAPCTRDTGAPAVSDGVLWGVASWGIRTLCGTERYPAMFSFTASKSNIDFLTNATRFLMADERFYPFPDRLPH